MIYNVDSIIRCGKVLQREDFVFFWGHVARVEKQMKACLSQWFPCSFLVDGIYYNCAEQFMMAEKARLFHDEDALQKIMQAYDPMEQKKMGRRVQGYDDALWKEHCFDAVVRGNVAKFSQNEKLRDFLLSTGDKILVEASPKDNVWGIGLDEESPDAANPKRWPGTNLLGFALMEVRDKIKDKL
jgi:ribA/ribD-fused uncharacterized protein